MKFAKKRQNNVITEVNRVAELIIWRSGRFDTLETPYWYDECMLEGRCPKCGLRYFGWGLRYSRYQTCSKCGVALEIIADGGKVSKGYSPFTAQEHVVIPPTDVPAGESAAKDRQVQSELDT